MIPREILKNIRRIEIRSKRVVNDLFSGEYHSAFKGQGMEFEEVRQYQPGDDIRLIDWNVTARSGEPYIKKFREERELTVMLLIDASASGRFGTVERTKGEFAAELAAVLAFSAIKNNDKVGLIIFTDQIELFVPPQKGRGHVLRIIRDILFFSPSGRKTDLAGALEFFNRVQKRKAVAFLVSDFLDDDFWQPLEVAGRKHDLVCMRIADPREQALDRLGLVELIDAETGDVVMVDTSSRAFTRTFASRAAEDDAWLQRQLRRRNLDFVSLRTDQPFVKPLIEFFQRRERRP